MCQQVFVEGVLPAIGRVEHRDDARKHVTPMRQVGKANQLPRGLLIANLTERERWLLVIALMQAFGHRELLECDDHGLKFASQPSEVSAARVREQKRVIGVSGNNARVSAFRSFSVSPIGVSLLAQLAMFSVNEAGSHLK
ncbi:TPA: hypothetical protein QDC27_002531 [Burkholderia cepacia ATCC 25416]|nr:hypothetical protein [Burkholderia cepacia ATCC 25416]HDR9792633.1 hypothetical protein [Burkholderia cepacia ATCC 25416]